MKARVLDRVLDELRQHVFARTKVYVVSIDCNVVKGHPENTDAARETAPTSSDGRVAVGT